MNIVIRTFLVTVAATLLVVLVNRFVLGVVDVPQIVRSALIFAALFFAVSLLVAKLG